MAFTVSSAIFCISFSVYLHSMDRTTSKIIFVWVGPGTILKSWMFSTPSSGAKASEITGLHFVYQRVVGLGPGIHMYDEFDAARLLDDALVLRSVMALHKIPVRIDLHVYGSEYFPGP